VETLTLEDWDLTMAVNLRSLYLVTRAFLPGLLNAGESSVVNIASLAGRNGFEGGTAYCASKHAVLGFSKALMFEVRRRGVRVIAVCPGTVDTSFGDERHVRHTRSDRALQPEDVAQTVLATLGLPARAMVSELDMRPSNP
jgi:3-oxoacyl-[acyl-carrier protein] reductase